MGDREDRWGNKIAVCARWRSTTRLVLQRCGPKRPVIQSSVCRDKPIFSTEVSAAARLWDRFEFGCLLSALVRQSERLRC